MRAGDSAQQVSAETGWPLDRVERYAEQPLAERAFIADQALTVEIRRSGSSVSVRDTAVEVLARAGIDFGDLVLDSARRADGKWTVRGEVPGRSISAVWVYDHAGRSLQPLDDDARRLMGVEPEPSEADAPADMPAPEQPSEPRPRLVAVPDALPDELPADVDVVTVAEGDEVLPPASAESANQETLALPLPNPSQPERPVAPKSKPRAKGRRASVPSWDEILFGTSTHDAD